MSLFKKIESGETTVHDSTLLKIVLILTIIGSCLLGFGLAGLFG